MGTSKTAQYKNMVVHRWLQGAIDKGVDIDKEKFIAQVMVECGCERRKALEVINSQILVKGFKEDTILGRKTYLCPRVEDIAPEEKAEAEKEAEEILTNGKDIQI